MVMAILKTSAELYMKTVIKTPVYRIRFSQFKTVSEIFALI